MTMYNKVLLLNSWGEEITYYHRGPKSCNRLIITSIKLGGEVVKYKATVEAQKIAYSDVNLLWYEWQLGGKI